MDREGHGTICQRGSCSRSKAVQPMSRDPSGTGVTWAPGVVTEAGEGVRSQLYGSAGSGDPCLPWLQTLFGVMAKITKLLKKWNSFSFTPCVKKKPLQDSSLNHSREKGQRQWNLVQSCSNFVWLCPNTGTWGATKKLMNDLECGNAEQCHVHTGMGFIRSRQRLSCENRDFNVTPCREIEQKNKLKRW